MEIDFNKMDGLVPAVVQDARSLKVLMVGFMNEEALKVTKDSGRVTFFSRSKQRLWTKGETSGNFLELKEVLLDCDRDTLLVKAVPHGPACHTGQDTCFNEKNCASELGSLDFLRELEETIDSRRSDPSSESYTSKLFADGINRISQKVGEEAVETVVAALGEPDSLPAEAADLIFHLMVLLNEKGLGLVDVVSELKKRRR